MTRTTKRITAKLATVPKLAEACSDILEASAEYATTYWADVQSVSRNGERTLRVVVRDGERERKPAMTVEPADIVRALEKLRDGKVTTCHSRFIPPAALILAGRYDDVSSEMDTEVYDVIFQIASLGEVVYS